MKKKELTDYELAKKRDERGELVTYYQAQSERQKRKKCNMRTKWSILKEAIGSFKARFQNENPLVVRQPCVKRRN